jgi:class 3 adenylate cyclase
MGRASAITKKLTAHNFLPVPHPRDEKCRATSPDNGRGTQANNIVVHFLIWMLRVPSSTEGKMRCLSCNAENQPMAKFCIECGAAFSIPCARCDFKNPPSAKFCQECGAPLKPGSASEQLRVANLPTSLGKLTTAPREYDDVPDGERKTVTALFADIKGSMELMENLDPEEARAIIDPALKLMIEAVHSYGGHIIQSTGDGIFALFGAPVAHEDHPQQALYAALRMQDEMRHYAARLRQAGKMPIEVRVGLNTGEVVARSIAVGDSHAEYAPIGHSASVAARMQALTPTGSIVVTDTTRKLCEGYFTFKSLGPTVVKGVSEPVEVFEVTGLGLLRTRFQRAAVRGLTRFVGRQRELAVLMHAAERVQAGHGQIVAVMADPGVGKSRLFHEFRGISQSGWMVLEAYSVSHGKASAYLPVLDLLSTYFEIGRDDDDHKRRERIRGKVLGLDRKLEDALPYLYLLHGIADSGDSLAQMDPHIKRRRTLEAIKRIMLRESLNQPLMLIFEDLQWIDGETQALLNLLVDAIANAHILLLVNYRPEYRHGWGSCTHYTQLRLDPLGRESAAKMLSALLGDEAELEPLKRLVADKTDGNPFFVEEMVQALFEQGGTGTQWPREAQPITGRYKNSTDGAGGARLTYRPAAAERKGTAANPGGDGPGVYTGAYPARGRYSRSRTRAYAWQSAKQRVSL